MPTKESTTSTVATLEDFPTGGKRGRKSRDFSEYVALAKENAPKVIQISDDVVRSAAYDWASKIRKQFPNVDARAVKLPDHENASLFLKYTGK